jgi:hypothetical protein
MTQGSGGLSPGAGATPPQWPRNAVSQHARPGAHSRPLPHALPRAFPFGFARPASTSDDGLDSDAAADATLDDESAAAVAVVAVEGAAAVSEVASGASLAVGADARLGGRALEAVPAPVAAALGLS